jgi:hypothetical protein
MTKKARKPKLDPSKIWAYRPPPTKTPQEMMNWLDAENMVRLLHELISCMPGAFKEALKERGSLQFKVQDYDILITTKSRFEKPISRYGKAVW